MKRMAEVVLLMFLAAGVSCACGRLAGQGEKQVWRKKVFRLKILFRKI